MVIVNCPLTAWVFSSRLPVKMFQLAKPWSVIYSPQKTLYVKSTVLWFCTQSGAEVTWCYCKHFNWTYWRSTYIYWHAQSVFLLQWQTVSVTAGRLHILCRNIKNLMAFAPPCIYNTKFGKFVPKSLAYITVRHNADFANPIHMLQYRLAATFARYILPTDWP
jgi:hypothetical protein